MLHQPHLSLLVLQYAGTYTVVGGVCLLVGYEIQVIYSILVL